MNYLKKTSKKEDRILNELENLIDSIDHSSEKFDNVRVKLEEHER